MNGAEKKRGIRSVIIKPFFLILNAVFIFLLLVSYTASRVSPDTFWPMAFAGVAYPLLLLINVFFVIWWLIFRKRYFLLSLVAIIAGYNQFRALFAFHFSDHSAKADSQNEIKLMTFNCRLFDLYNWTQNLNSRQNIFNMLKRESPDILCLQEFYQSDGTQFDNVVKLKKELRTKNIHVAYSHTERVRDHWGIATCSVYPIINRKTIRTGFTGG